MKTDRHLRTAFASFLVLAAPLHALPDVRFDKSKSLGTWEQFVTSLGLQNEPSSGPFPLIYFDTDNLVVGEYLWGDIFSDFFEKRGRRPLRYGVGRIVKQDGGPEIAVYDFDEIYTFGDRGNQLPGIIVLLGRRPALIVADGQISNWPKDPFNTLEIWAYNSRSPDKTSLKSPAGSGRGRSSNLTVYEVNDETQYAWSGAGSGGYGTAGQAGRSLDIFNVGTVPGGQGGAACFSWDVLRAGSHGGGDYTFSRKDGLRRRVHSGGSGGGAVWVKSGGRLDLTEIEAVGLRGEKGTHDLPGGGSGGHVILESPEIPSISYVRLFGFDGGGAGVLEFRGTPGMPSVVSIYGNQAGEDQLIPVGLPRGVTFAGREPKLLGDYREVARPKVPAPTLTLSKSHLFTKGKKFTIAASTTARHGPAAIRFRSRPVVRTAASKFFGPWSAETLPGDRLKKSWQKEFPSPEEGIWQFEIVADDIKGGRSKGEIFQVLVDHTKPGLYVDPEYGVNATGSEGAYAVETIVYEDTKGPINYEDFSGPARVEYRLKPPGAKTFGKWQRVSVGAPDQYANWPSVELTIPVTLAPLVRGEWTMELRAVDRAGNIGEARPLGIRH